MARIVAALTAVLLALVAVPGSAQAAFSGANGRILVQGGVSGGPFMIDPDGSHHAAVPGFAGNGSGTLSPDGQREFYNGVVRTLATGAEVRIAPADPFRSPRFSPDGTQVAWTTGTTVFRAPADGSGPATPVTTEHLAGGIAWTPDGSEIVVAGSVSGCDGPTENGCLATELVAFNATTGARRDIVPPSFVDDNEEGADSPDVAGDGSRVVFRQDVSPPCPPHTNPCPAPFDSIVSVPLAGGGPTVLRTSGGVLRAPAFSPDGKQVVYVFLRSSGADLRAVGSTGVGDHLVDDNGGPGYPPGISGPLQWLPAPAPIIFIPGFLASKLRCGSTPLWLNLPSPQLGAMELGPDGTTDAGNGTCSGPVVPDGVVESAAGQDIHGSTLQFLNRIAPGNNYVYPWDWRKSPQQAIAGLDAFVDQVRSKNGGAKVEILAHSFGGLLTRLYIDDPARASKVQRALFVGTPSWGAPKALFPLATGQETPSGLIGLDVFLTNNNLKQLAHNLAGAFTLYPSGHYGTWLTVQGRNPSVLDTDLKLTDYVSNDLLGNGGLLQDALDLHDNVLDGWKTNGVDLRAIVGTGLNTVVGVKLIPGGAGGPSDKAELTFGNGDETVPARSATQGTPGTNDPLGEDIPIRYNCGVSHVPLAGDAALTDANAGGFLQRGEELTAPDQPCDNGGFSVELFGVSLDPFFTGPSPPDAAAARDGGPAAQAVLGAEAAGDIDVIRFPSVNYLVTNDSHPVHLEIPDSNAHLVVRRLDGETQGPPQVFDAQPGGLVIDTTTGKAISVKALGKAGGGGGAGSVDGGTSGSATAGAGTTAAGGSSPAGAGSVPVLPGAQDRAPPRVKVSVRRRGARYLVTLHATDPAGVRRLEYRLSKRGRFRTYRHPLLLTRKRVKALRVRAIDRLGNTSRPIAVALR